MDGSDGEHGYGVGAGHECPAAQQPLGGGRGKMGPQDHGTTDDGTGRRESGKQKAESRNRDGGTGRGMGAVQATEEEQAAIRAMLRKRAESAPAGAGVGRASALAWAGFKLAAIVLLAAGVGIGLGDGDEFDDVGCSVAQQPGGTSHGARSAQARERAGGKLAGSDGGSAGSSGGGGPRGGGNAETLKAEREAGKPETGKANPSSVAAPVLCIDTAEGGPRRVESRDLEVAVPEVAARAVVKAVEAAMERFEGELAGVRKDFADWQKNLGPANEASQAALPEPPQPDEPNLSLAAKVFELLTALDPGNRLRKAPPIKVFNLYYRQRLGAAEIARKCNCNGSLIYDRLAAIQAKVPWTPQQLQDVSPHVEAMQESLTDSRAKGIYRKGAAYGGEDDNQVGD